MKCWIALACWSAALQAQQAPTRIDFVRDVQPLLRAKCVECHGPGKQKGGFRLDARAAALRGGDQHRDAIVPHQPDQSVLLALLVSADPDERMPKDRPPLTPAEVQVLRAWIEQGAAWPDGVGAEVADPRDWWSLRPLTQPPLPAGATGNPIDAFVRARLAAAGLAPSPQADRRTLIRRVTFDLIGLPPSYEEVEAFAADPAPDAYERLVDRLLASPRYGERWARHWLDVVHFGESHGYDKDQPRPHAWPYRDYVIRAFNADKPYAAFVREQIAGDVLAQDPADGAEALGFLAAGPWDLIGHAEVPETKIDGKVARHLDRDDMVSNTMQTFCSLTVHCAQCHNHKFDPVPQVDYYRLQAVFAAIDRTDLAYDRDPAVGAQRRALEQQRERLQQEQAELTAQLRARAGEPLVAAEAKLAAAEQARRGAERPEFGYHSAIAAHEGDAKWVQVDLGRSVAIERIELLPCHDDFNRIGDGFGYPRRLRLELAATEGFAAPLVVAQSDDDIPKPGIAVQSFAVGGRTARYVRVTATRLATRKDDFIFALAELRVLQADGENAAAGARVTALDSTEAPPRWRTANLVDGYAPAVVAALAAEEARGRSERDGLLARAETPAWQRAQAANAEARRTNEQQLAALPEPHHVYAGAVHHGSGAFAGTGANGGRPRPIHVLPRGDVTKPGREVGPGALSALAPQLPDLDVAADAPERARRAALAQWLTDPRHPLTWRSIVNRVWHYHFGRGLVDSPNDFGHMGQMPSHPELLDWLAADFRDHGGSLKALHRRICTSAAYQQVADHRADAAALDAGNALLWRANRRKLEAEAVRDSILAAAGALDLTMGGPSFQDFAITHPEHSPHYEYDQVDLQSPVVLRRAVYRFVVRSQQQPWMAALDCADPSMLVDKRNQSVSPLQALALRNDRLPIAMAKRLAERATAMGGDLRAQVAAAFRCAMSRAPRADELDALTALASAHGLANACRALFNLNEFVFVD